MALATAAREKIIKMVKFAWPCPGIYDDIPQYILISVKFCIEDGQGVPPKLKIS